jgi:hypothetical protein
VRGTSQERIATEIQKIVAKKGVSGTFIVSINK